MKPFTHNSQRGSPRVAAKYARGLENAPVRQYSGRELAKQDRIFSHLASGGIAHVAGPQEAVVELAAYVSRLQKDLGKLEKANGPLNRMMVEVRQHRVPMLEPAIEQRHIALLCGEDDLGDDDDAVLVPYAAVNRLITKLSEKWHVDALGVWLQAGEDVLAPRSQETYTLFREAIVSLKASIPRGGLALDMGCGCGVLSFIAAKELAEREVIVTAADVLPEAIGTTLLNAERLYESGTLDDGAVKVAPPGNMFERLGERLYDLIVFNAPWVVAPVRSRCDVALNDEKQRVLATFFAELGDRLAATGTLVLGYADNSGDKAVARALELASNAGFGVTREISARIATHRKKGKWERIYVWELHRNTG